MTQDESDPFAGIFYGEAGIGKSSFAAEFENDGGVAFVVDPHERGIFDLIKYHQCPTPTSIDIVTGWEHLLKTGEEIARRKDIHAAAFDSLTGLQELCHRYHCKKYFNDDWTKEGFFAFQQGPKNAAARDWPDLVEMWENIRQSGKEVIILAHEQVKQFKNPDGNDYDKYSPFLEKDAWATVHRWAPAIVFYKSQIGTVKVGARHKADESSMKRVFFTVQGATYVAKNRYGLEPVILAGNSNAEAYAAFRKAYNKAARV